MFLASLSVEEQTAYVPQLNEEHSEWKVGLCFGCTCGPYAVHHHRSAYAVVGHE